MLVDSYLISNLFNLPTKKNRVSFEILLNNSKLCENIWKETEFKRQGSLSHHL